MSPVTGFDRGGFRAEAQGVIVALGRFWLNSGNKKPDTKVGFFYWRRGRDYSQQSCSPLRGRRRFAPTFLRRRCLLRSNHEGSSTLPNRPIKNPTLRSGSFIGGEGGIRTLETLLTFTHFTGVRLQPLGHLSNNCV